jgi:hypothetical protein
VFVYEKRAATMMSKFDLKDRHRGVKLLALFLVVMFLFECCCLPLVEAGKKGRDIIIYDGKVIVKGGKKKGNIIISNGSHGQGEYKYKKKYIDYGGYWR